MSNKMKNENTSLRVATRKIDCSKITSLEEVKIILSGLDLQITVDSEEYEKLKHLIEMDGLTHLGDGPSHITTGIIEVDDTDLAQLPFSPELIAEGTEGKNEMERPKVYQGLSFDYYKQTDIDPLLDELERLKADKKND